MGRIPDFTFLWATEMCFPICSTTTFKAFRIFPHLNPLWLETTQNTIIYSSRSAVRIYQKILTTQGLLICLVGTFAVCTSTNCTSSKYRLCFPKHVQGAAGLRQKYFLSWQQKASLASRHLHNSPFRVSLFGLAESKMWARRRGGRAAVEGRGCYLCSSLLLSFLTLNLIARCRDRRSALRGPNGTHSFTLDLIDSSGETSPF